MKFIVEHIPEKTTYTVRYEPRLAGLEASPHDRDRIDAFWTGIFLTSINPAERSILANLDSTHEITDIELFPVDYDLRIGKIGVILASTISHATEQGNYAGPVGAADMNIDGTLLSSSGKTGHYSGDMRPYMRDLLAETARRYDPIDPRFL